MKKKRINTRQKMYETNGMIKKWLLENDFKFLYLFPHLRFSKDYHIEDCDFDAICIKDRYVWFIQFKTTDKLPKKVKSQYKELEEKYNIKCAWITRIKKEIIFQTSNN